jgi:hypothetical protein
MSMRPRKELPMTTAMDHPTPRWQARLSPARLIVGALALAAILLSLWRLDGLERGATVERLTIGATPATVWRPAAGPAGPVVVVAHGFAGSQPLMRGYAAALARAGYVAVTFDFLGHGRHPDAMTGDVRAVDGATAGILGQLQAVADRVRGFGDGRLALLGHSMAGDVIARMAADDPSVTATVGVSILSPVVDGTTPPNLLLVVGEYEGWLADWALDALREGHGPDVVEGRTYGDPSDGSARRVAIADGVEHIAVLYSREAYGEAVAWLDAAFGRAPAPAPEGRGLWIVLLIAGIVAAGWPAAALLPRLAPGQGGGLRGWRFAAAALAPAIATPLLLSLTEFRFLPMVVGDYLAAHFALYGVLTAVALRALGATPPRAAALTGAVLPALAVAAFSLGVLGWALHAYVSNFAAIPERAGVIVVLLVGTASFFLADEWLTRGPLAPRLAYPATKLAFLGSLAAATAIDLERLFFLIIIAPALGLFFLVYGLFSRWSYSATGAPFVAGLANALATAWAVGVTFPLITG